MFSLAIEEERERERGREDLGIFLCTGNSAGSRGDGPRLASFCPLFKKLNRGSRVSIEGVTEADDELGNNLEHAHAYGTRVGACVPLFPPSKEAWKWNMTNSAVMCVSTT